MSARPGAGPGADRVRPVHVWAIAFVYAAAAALLVQLVVLPHLLPAWHWGSGLLVGGDWIEFHVFAVDRAARLRTQGWDAFELRPFGHAPTGVASVVYALTWPEPWTLIPLHAALHATAAALLFRLLRGLVTDWRWAAAGILPFVFYPTALTWITQIHKDGFFIAGYFALFAAWSDLARRDPAAGIWRAVRGNLALLLAGFGLVWLVRPDISGLAHATAGFALVLLAVQLGLAVRRGERHWRRRAAILGLATLTTLGGAWLTSAPAQFVAARAVPSGETPSRGRPVIRRETRVPNWDMDIHSRGVRAIPWYRSPWLPAAVDRAAYRLALTREIFLVNYITGQSNLDLHVGLYRAGDVARYLPRALQIGLLAPFPTQWGARGSMAWTTVSRRVVMLEMLGVYAGLLGLAVAAWRWRRRTDFWIAVLPCLALLTLYSLAVPNLGALHRFRYGFLMVLVGMGIAGGLDRWRERARRPRAGPP